MGHGCQAGKELVNYDDCGTSTSLSLNCDNALSCCLTAIDHTRSS